MQNSAILQAEVVLNPVQQARRGLVRYFAILIPVWVLLEGIIVSRDEYIPWIMLVMLTPALASVAARLLGREGFGDVSFRLGGRRSMQAILLALLLPILVRVIAYGVAWATGLAELTPPGSPTFPAVTNPLARLGLQFLSVWNVGFLIGLVLAAGEEIGWRGSWPVIPMAPS